MKHCLSCRTQIDTSNTINSFNPITKETTIVYTCCSDPYIMEYEQDDLNSNRLVLIDADSFAYKIGYRFKDSPVTDITKADLYTHLDKLIYYIISETKTINFIGLLIDDKTDEDILCFRYGLCAVYKAKRPKTPDFIIKWGVIIKDYLVEEWKFQYVNRNIEVDDAVALLAEDFKDKEIIIASIDKDLKQIPTLHFNYTTGEKVDARRKNDRDIGKIIKVKSKLKGYGDIFLAAQCIMGDNIDGVVGIKGIADVGAYNALISCNSRFSINRTLLKLYKEKGLTKQNLIDNYRLLKLIDSIDKYPYLIKHKKVIVDNMNNIKNNISTIKF